MKNSSDSVATPDFFSKVDRTSATESVGEPDDAVVTSLQEHVDREKKLARDFVAEPSVRRLHRDCDRGLDPDRDLDSDRDT